MATLARHQRGVVSARRPDGDGRLFREQHFNGKENSLNKYKGDSVDVLTLQLLIFDCKYSQLGEHLKLKFRYFLYKCYSQ